MTPTDTSELLEYLTAAYPNAKLGDETPVVWMQHFATIDTDDARTAAYRWVASHEWMPTIAQLLTLCREERNLARLADNPRALPPLEERDPVVAATFVDATRAALTAARHGGDAEATFSSMAPAAFPERAVTYRCACGEGQGWVTEPSGTVRPCDRCRPEQHALWVGGHYAPGHRGCPECRRSA